MLTFFCFFAGQFSPVTSTKRPHPHPPSSPAHDHTFSSQSTSRLEVPQLFLPGVRSQQNNFRHLHHHRRVPPHSTSSSPSTSSQSSPCLTPMSPRSPLDPHSGFNNLHRSVAIVLSTDENSTDEEEEEGEEEAEFYEGSEGFMSDSSNSSFNDGGVVGPARHPGLQLPTRGIAAQSLPNLLMSERHHGRGGGGGNGEGMYATSEDNLQSWYNRKPSLSGTISTADSKTSTLVGSIMVREREREREKGARGQIFFSFVTEERREREEREERERGERGGEESHTTLLSLTLISTSKHITCSTIIALFISLQLKCMPPFTLLSNLCLHLLSHADDIVMICTITYNKANDSLYSSSR